MSVELPLVLVYHGGVGALHICQWQFHCQGLESMQLVLELLEGVEVALGKSVSRFHHCALQSMELALTWGGRKLGGSKVEESPHGLSVDGY